MADFAGTIALTSYAPAFGGHPGFFGFTVTLSASTYTAGNLNISTLAQFLANVNPADIAEMSFEVDASVGYIVRWSKAATPTFANMGTLNLNTATGTAATGTLTFTVRGKGFIVRQASPMRLS